MKKRLLYFVLALSLLILCAACSDNKPTNSNDMNLIGSEQITVDGARAFLQSWLDNHPFEFETYIDDDMTSEDEYFVTFVLYQTREFAYIKVDKNNGELFQFEYLEEEYVPIDEWYEMAINITPTEVGDLRFDRTRYYTGITHEQLLRYPSDSYFSMVYFARCEVVQVYEPQLYLVKYSGRHVIIDDRKNTGMNALEGDLITVYGTFYGNETVTWTDGRTEQTPLISVDQLIFNYSMPEITDLAQALVDSLNNFPNSSGIYGSGQYVSDATVKVIFQYNEYSNSLFMVGPRDPIYADGYRVEIKFKDPNDEFKMQYDLDTVSLEIPEGYNFNAKELVWVTLEITEITRNAVEPSWLTVRMTARDYEQYEEPADM